MLKKSNTDAEKMQRLKKYAAVFAVIILCIAVVVVATGSQAHGEEKVEISASATSDITKAPDPTGTAQPTGTPDISHGDGKNEPTSDDGAAETALPTKKPSDRNTPKPVDLTLSHEIEGSLPQSDAVSGEYFDDVVFIGDSVSLKLKNYEATHNVLGDAAFLTAGSFSTYDALNPVSGASTHPVYDGAKRKLEDSVPLTGKHKVYIMLGMNDIGRTSYTLEQAVARMEQVCDNILANADVSIFIQSMTPLASNSRVRTANGLNNDRILQYNQLLCELCLRRGWHFVNVASVMYDDIGNLRSEYCSDNNVGGMGIHFTASGCEAWVQYLYTHTYRPPTPTPEPTPEPTTVPTDDPTNETTNEPTEETTDEPTAEATDDTEPTEIPTETEMVENR